MRQPLWKTDWQFLTKLNMHLPYDSAIALFSTYPREMEAYVHTHTQNLSMNVHGRLLLIAQNWTFHRQMVEQYIHTMEYYSAIKSTVDLVLD